MLHGDSARTLETIRYPDRVDSAIEERLALLEQGTGEHLMVNRFVRGSISQETAELTDDTSGTVSYLVILTFRQLYKQLRDWVLDFHLAQDSRAVVRHGDFAIWRYQNFIQAYWNVSMTA